MHTLNIKQYLKNIKQYLKKKLFIQTPKILGLKKNNFLKNYANENSSIFSFGEKNANKTYYVIKRTPGTGLFSNVVFVLNHLKIAREKNYVPIVDMENFPTIYNEDKKIHGTHNSWEYYFNNFSDEKIDEIYQSKKVFITSNSPDKYFFKDLNTDKIRKFFRDNIQIKKRYLRAINYYSKKIFKNQKILGVHFRGTSYKRSPGHPFPATKKQIINNVEKIMSENNYDKIFLVTEENNYKNLFVSKFKDKVLFLKKTYRSDKNDAFNIYPRFLHRFKLGRDILLETLLLSKCDALVYVTSNVSSAAIAWQLNPNQKRYKIDNGLNSNNEMLAQILWYLKKNLPHFIGGFKN